MILYYTLFLIINIVYKIIKHILRHALYKNYNYIYLDFNTRCNNISY